MRFESKKLNVTRICDPSDDLYDAWCMFAAQHPERHFFQSDPFFRLIKKWPGAEALLLVLVDASDNICGSLLAAVLSEYGGFAGWLSSRTIVYGGALVCARPDVPEHTLIDSLLKALVDKQGSRPLFTQLRSSGDWSVFHSAFAKNGFRFEDHLNLIVDTRNPEHVWEGLSKSKQRQVSKSLKNGATVVSSPSTAQIDEFYDILEGLYRNKIRKPLPPRAVFRTFNRLFVKEARPSYDKQTGGGAASASGGEKTNGRAGGPSAPGGGAASAFGGEKTNGRAGGPSAPDGGAASESAGGAPYAPGGEKTNGRGGGPSAPGGGAPDKHKGTTHRSSDSGYGVILLVEFGGRVVGGIVCPALPGRCMYEWYVCGLDREMNKLGVYPSVLATWSALAYAADSGMDYFDFMGMGVPEKPYGVRDFKARFGGKWVNHGRYVRINSRFRYFLARCGYLFWQVWRLLALPGRRQ